MNINESSGNFSQPKTALEFVWCIKNLNFPVFQNKFHTEIFSSGHRAIERHDLTKDGKEADITGMLKQKTRSSCMKSHRSLGNIMSKEIKREERERERETDRQTD